MQFVLLTSYIYVFSHNRQVSYISNHSYNRLNYVTTVSLLIYFCNNKDIRVLYMPCNVPVVVENNLILHVFFFFFFFFWGGGGSCADQIFAPPTWAMLYACSCMFILKQRMAFHNWRANCRVRAWSRLGIWRQRRDHWLLPACTQLGLR